MQLITTQNEWTWKAFSFNLDNIGVKAYPDPMENNFIFKI